MLNLLVQLEMPDLQEKKNQIVEDNARAAKELRDIEDPTERERRAQEIKAQVARLKETALAAGGMFVLGTERHESRRIDNQLRGRSGRQATRAARSSSSRSKTI